MVDGPILGIDVGEKRVGVAVGGASPHFVAPLATYPRANGEAEREILTLVEERGAKLIVAGLPLGARGEFNEQCSKVQKFCRRLQRRTTVQIHFIDEYSSSLDASELISSTGRRRASALGLDAAAAAVILSRYLDRVEAPASE